MVQRLVSLQHPLLGNEGKPVKGKARRKPKRAASEDGTLGGRVINQLLKHARDSDMSTTDLRQKYQKAWLILRVTIDTIVDNAVH